MATRDIADIKKCLGAVENVATGFDSLQHDLRDTRKALELVEMETRALRARLDDTEDFSRRDNLIFYGFAGSPTKTNEQSEQKVLNLIADTFELSLTRDCTAHAHRTGTFDANKTRPLIVKFSAHKTKVQVHFKRSLIKEKKKSMSEDFSAAIHKARKRLIDYVKEFDLKVNLRHNKLIANGKCYGYNADMDLVFKVRPALIQCKY